MINPEGIPKTTKEEKVAAITRYDAAVDRLNTSLRNGIR